MILRSAYFLVGCLASGALSAAETCGIDEPCQISGGFYRTSPPAGWDGKSALPTVLFFHGYQGSAAEEMTNKGLRRAFSDLGLLLIFPDSGPPGFWMHETQTPGARDEIEYTRTVLADVKRRWPVDERHVWVAGFSDGGFMVWNLACHGRGEFRAYVALSGAFLEPLPRTCEGGPVNLLQFHGLTDEMVPMEGRSIGGVFTQGDVFASFSVLRDLDRCRRDPDHYEVRGPFAVRRWDETCTTGKRLAMAVHSGGHEMLEGWVELAWEWTKSSP
jgi:polyhydroxybutyrate depolymerase